MLTAISVPPPRLPFLLVIHVIPVGRIFPMDPKTLI